MTMGDVMGLMGRTFRDPKEGAAEVLSLGIPRESHFMLVMLVVILFTIASSLPALLIGQTGSEAASEGPSVLMTLVMQFGQMVLLIALVQGVGRMFGGTAVIEETTVLMCWLQFVMIFLLLAGFLIMIVSPQLGVFAILLGAGFQMWLLTHFVAVLHGFRSLWPVFFGILGAGFVIAFLLSILLAALGFVPPMPTGAA